MIISITGRSGSGKTTVINNLIKIFGNDSVCYLHQESYYNDQTLNIDWKIRSKDVILSKKDKISKNISEVRLFDYNNLYLKKIMKGVGFRDPNLFFLKKYLEYSICLNVQKY